PHRLWVAAYCAAWRPAGRAAAGGACGKWLWLGEGLSAAVRASGCCPAGEGALPRPARSATCCRLWLATPFADGRGGDREAALRSATATAWQLWDGRADHLLADGLEGQCAATAGAASRHFAGRDAGHWRWPQRRLAALGCGAGGGDGQR